MINPEYINSKSKAQKLLKESILGGSIIGMRFSLPTLYIEQGDKEYYLNIESKYAVFDQIPETWPESEDEIQNDQKQEKQKIIDLDRISIVNIQLMDSYPSLIIHFQNGKILFLNGNHNLYESWQLGELFDEGKGITLIAIPGGNISFYKDKNA